MSRFFIVFVLSIILFSCRSGVPKDIIQQAEMENVLFDIHVVDGYASIYSGATNDSLKKIISPYYKGVYKKYGIDSALYHHSLDYYYNHPELLKNMYENVTKKLTQTKGEIIKDEEKAAKKAAKDKEIAAKKEAQKIAKEKELAAKKAAEQIAKDKELTAKKAALKIAKDKESALKKKARKNTKPIEKTSIKK